MNRSYRSLWVSAGVGLALVVAQVVQLVILRRVWWGWPAVGSGVILHSTVWAVIAASLLGVWLWRGSVVDGSSMFLATSPRSRLRVVMEQLWPCLVILVVGQVFMGVAVDRLGRDGFGHVNWLLLAPGSCWIAAALLWGMWCALHTPWKSCWLIAPGVPLVLITLATRHGWGLRLLPILPVADPFGRVPWGRSSVLILAAVAVLGLVASCTLRLAGGRLVALLSLVVFVGAAVLPVRQYAPAPGAEDVRCAMSGERSVCVPEAYRALDASIRTSIASAVAEHPELFDGATHFTAAPELPQSGVISIIPEAGPQGVSMLATDADVRLALARGLTSSEQCVPTAVEPILLLRVAEILGAQPAAQFEEVRQTVALHTASDPVLLDVDVKVRGMSEQQLGAFQAARRSDKGICEMTPEQFLER